MRLALVLRKQNFQKTGLTGFICCSARALFPIGTYNARDRDDKENSNRCRNRNSVEHRMSQHQLALLALQNQTVLGRWSQIYPSGELHSWPCEGSLYWPWNSWCAEPLRKPGRWYVQMCLWVHNCRFLQKEIIWHGWHQFEHPGNFAETSPIFISGKNDHMMST